MNIAGSSHWCWRLYKDERPSRRQRRGAGSSWSRRQWQPDWWISLLISIRRTPADTRVDGGLLLLSKVCTDGVCRASCPPTNSASGLVTLPATMPQGGVSFHLFSHQVSISNLLFRSTHLRRHGLCMEHAR